MDGLKIFGVFLLLLTAPINLFGQLPGDVSSWIEKLTLYILLQAKEIESKKSKLDL